MLAVLPALASIDRCLNEYDCVQCRQMQGDPGGPCPGDGSTGGGSTGGGSTGGDDADTADLPVLGIDVSEDGDILVARVGMVRGTPGTHLTLYGTGGLAKQSATVERPWNLMFATAIAFAAS